MKKTERKRTNVDRRTFVKMLPAAGVAGLTATHLNLPLAAAQQPQAPQTPQRVTKEMLHAAEQLIGLELNRRSGDYGIAGCESESQHL